MIQSLRQSIACMLYTFAAPFALASIIASIAFAQTTTTQNATLTSQQLARSLGNYGIIPLGSTAATQLTGVKTTSRDRTAHDRENLQAIEFAGGHISALIGGFEQGAGFGFGLEFSTADTIPGVIFRAKLLGSTRFYRRVEGEAYVPKVFSDKTHASVWFNYLRRTQDNFFNIGPRTPQNPETNYDVEERSYNASLFHDIRKGSQVGVYARVSNASAYQGQDDNDIPVDVLFTGVRPANVVDATRWLPGLNNNAKIFSYGAFAEFDLRNNEAGLPKGAYGFARVASYDGLKNEAFSDYGWNEIELDGRVYIPVRGDSTSLAMRAYAELKDPKRGSQIPFYEQSYFGGRSHGRGFRNFRFRGNNVLLLAVEPRQTIWNGQKGRGLDVFVFGDFGQVWGDNRSALNAAIRANDKFDSANWRAAAGGGFQFRISKSTAIRLDYGRSNERSMTYFSVSRGF
ncbi:MAG: BamA/TamA family outer membrane protein [Acidobacteriota bacterium]|nr:BamA/TamA family outer membrane protein [Acidobacteriota bacterium]